MAEYIKRDDLIHLFEAKADMATGTPKAVFHSVCKMIALLPSDDVVEVRHGEWIEGVSLEKCSLCGKKGFPDWWYCPNCGAKMDGKGEGE